MLEHSDNSHNSENKETTDYSPETAFMIKITDLGF